MIRCCHCGIKLYFSIGQDYGYANCPGCDQEIFVMIAIGQSFKPSQIQIDHETKTINIRHEDEIPQKAD